MHKPRGCSGSLVVYAKVALGFATARNCCGFQPNPHWRDLRVTGGMYFDEIPPHQPYEIIRQQNVWRDLRDLKRHTYVRRRARGCAQSEGRKIPPDPARREFDSKTAGLRGGICEAKIPPRSRQDPADAGRGKTMGDCDKGDCACGRTGQVRGQAWTAVDKARDLVLAVRDAGRMTRAERVEVLACVDAVVARVRAMGPDDGKEGER